MSGFYGYKAGCVQYGNRGDEVLVRLSSNYAQDHWKEVYEISDNCSRIDVELTVKTGADATETVNKEFKAAKRFAAKLEKPSTISVLATNNGPSTVYFNKRISDRFGRIYDKGAESNKAELAGCVRYEVEYKGKQANKVVQHLAIANSVPTECIKLCLAFFAERGVSPVPGWREPAGLTTGPTRECVLIDPEAFRTASDAERQLAWLRKSVSGTVVSLCAAVGIAPVLEALGLDQMVHVNEVDD